jgi:hypothetical protein
VGFPAPDQASWIIEPLLEVGLEVEQIVSLLFRLAFETTVGGIAIVPDVVRDQPEDIRTAWRHTVGRLIAPHAPDGTA